MSIESRFPHVRVPLIAALAVLCLALFAPPAFARYAYTGNYDDGTVSVIDTGTNQTVGAPISTGNEPSSLAMAPNGKALYVANDGSEVVTVVDTQTSQVIASIPTGIEAATIAVSPDGRTAYVTNREEPSVTVLDLQTNQVSGSPIGLEGTPWGVAFSPGGNTAYVTLRDDNKVAVIDTGSRQVVGAIPVEGSPINVVFSPSGTIAYVDSEENDLVSVIDTGSRQVVGAPIPVGEEPWGLALTPNGRTLYVSSLVEGSVRAIDTQTGQVVGAPIPVGEEPYEIAVTPDGKALYIANYVGESVSVIDTQTNQIATTIPVSGGPWQVAIVPDQSPVAAFKATPAKRQPLKLTFNAAGSVDPDGTIAKFDWNFGDGLSALNGGPLLSHTYKKAKTYSASLTLTDNEGCSGFVFTGRTAFCNGPAPMVQAVKVKAPNTFRFRALTRNPENGTAKLKIKLPAPGKLTVFGQKVKQVKRGTKQAATVTVTIRPKAKAKKELAMTGSAKLQIKVKFLPTGGKARTKGRTVKLIQKQFQPLAD